ncbi:uncharacterized protein LOC111990624 isoform X2 [Quercus suber]|uniref:uncharacterized protein LOC111990624 isoform X2 n=1 Tax=Quercus suber TaxID=58331 RepID=UPI000CE1A317|nr:uncharacterized protein LOC111990624 [Quercus suber]POE78731.1 hypothetical protein CFP56_68209 [Quercus suber]
MEAGMKMEIEESMELEDQLHKRFKPNPSLLATMESVTEPAMDSAMESVTEPAVESAMESVIEPAMDSAMEAVKDSAMESVTKPPETIWKSIRDRVLRSSDLPLTSEKGYDVEYIFYPYWTNSDRLLIKISQTGLDLNEVDREFAKLVPPPPPEEKTNLVLVICYFDDHPEKGYTFAWVRDFSSLYNTGNACDEDDLSDDDPDEAEVDDPDKAEVDEDEGEDEGEDEDEDDGDDFLYVVKSNRDPFDREDDSGDRFGFRRNYERTLAARVRRAMSKRTECRYVFGFD